MERATVGSFVYWAFHTPSLGILELFIRTNRQPANPFMCFNLKSILGFCAGSTERTLLYFIDKINIVWYLQQWSSDLIRFASSCYAFTNIFPRDFRWSKPKASPIKSNVNYPDTLRWAACAYFFCFCFCLFLFLFLSILFTLVVCFLFFVVVGFYCCLLLIVKLRCISENIQNSP